MATPFAAFSHGQNINKENQNVQQLKMNKNNIMQSGRKAPLGDLKNTQILTNFGKNMKTENENIFSSARKPSLFGDIKNLNTNKTNKGHLSKTDTKKKLTPSVAAHIIPKNTNLSSRKTSLNDHETAMYERQQKFKNLDYVEATRNVLTDDQINRLIFFNKNKENDVRKGLKLMQRSTQFESDLPNIVLTAKIYEDPDDDDDDTNLPKFEKISLFD